MQAGSMLTESHEDGELPLCDVLYWAEPIEFELLKERALLVKTILTFSELDKCTFHLLPLAIYLLLGRWGSYADRISIEPK